jgi:hypothetical protein
MMSHVLVMYEQPSVCSLLDLQSPPSSFAYGRMQVSSYFSRGIARRILWHASHADFQSSCSIKANLIYEDTLTRSKGLVK